MALASDFHPSNVNPHPNGRCCVFQPFDSGGPFDKRFDETISPAIVAAGFEPYRVDRDVGASIPIDTLHEEIKGAKVCLADIGTQNPNVMYELGFAIAAGQDVVLISAKSAEKFPFDIQHRQVIRYSLDSSSDFKALGDGITNRLNAILKGQETRQEIVAISKANPTTGGLRPHELSALAFLMSSSEVVGDRVPIYAITMDMENTGYNKLATRLALSNLSKKEYILLEWEKDEYGGMHALCFVTDAGETWLLENTDTLDLNLF